MRQNKTREMLDHWMELFWEAGNRRTRGGQPIWPDRSEVQPARFRKLLADMFILQPAPGDMVYRLAGTKLCALYGRELKQESFAAVYSGTDYKSAMNWTTRLGHEDYVVLICSTGTNRNGDQINLETLLTPLSHNGATGNRALGITVPTTLPMWIGIEPLVSQTIRSIRVLRPWKDDHFESGWPFEKPEANRRGEPGEHHLQVVPPPLYKPLASESGQPAPHISTSDWEQIGHLRVFKGGLDT